MAVFQKLSAYWAYPFVRYALIVGVLIALCSSLLGVTLVLKRFSFIGDGLSHVAFGGMSIAAVIGMTDDMPLTLGVTVVCAILLLRTGQNTKIKGDAAIAMLSVVVVIVFVLFYNKIFAVTFDEAFAKAVDTKANLYNLLIAVTIAVVIVLAMNLVGSLLISALVIFPALSAMRVYQSFRSVTICSAVLSVFCAVCGILLSILAGTPVGSTIVAVDIAAFGLFTLAGRLKGGAAA